MFVVCCSLLTFVFGVVCSLFVVCCMLFVVRRVLFVVLVLGVCCLLCVV